MCSLDVLGELPDIVENRACSPFFEPAREMPPVSTPMLGTSALALASASHTVSPMNTACGASTLA